MSRHGRSRRGQASMVSLALFSAVIVVGISTVVFVGTPVLEDMQDAAAIDAAKDMLSGLETQVRRVASAGEGSETTVGLRFARGGFVFDADRDEVRYELETDAQLIGPQTSKQIGNLRLSSGTSVSVLKRTVDGQDCWELENEHVAVCIRDVPKNRSEQIEADTVGYWRFNENGGGTARDNSSYNNDGSIIGALWTDGKQESALAFDGLNDYVSVSDDGSLQETDAVTMAAWVHPDTVKNQGIVAKGTSGDDRQYGMELRSDGEIRLSINGVTHDTAGFGYTAGNWYHIVGVIDSQNDNWRLYVNGVEELDVTETDDPPASNGNPLIIGAADSGTAIPFNGIIDEVRVWNRSLTADEAKWVFKQRGRMDYIDTEELILRYYNKDADEALDAEFSVRLRGDGAIPSTNNGTGHVKPRLTGTGLGEGIVDATVKSFFGVDYTVVFQLPAGADFLQVDVEE